VLLILSAPKVFSILVSDNEIVFKGFLFIFLLIIALSIGKISTGFAYATFVGLYLFLKHPKNIFVYVLGMGWIIFLLFFTQLIMRNSDEIKSLDFSRLNLEAIYVYVTDTETIYYSIQFSSIITIIGLTLLTLIYREKKSIIMTISGVINFIVLIVIVRIHSEFSPSDIFYFYYGYNSVLVLFTLQQLAFNLQSQKRNLISFKMLMNHKYTKMIVILSSLYFNAGYILQSLKLDRSTREEFLFSAEREALMSIDNIVLDNNIEIILQSKDFEFISNGVKSLIIYPELELGEAYEYIINMQLNSSKDMKLEISYDDKVQFIRTIKQGGNNFYFSIKNQNVNNLELKFLNSINAYVDNFSFEIRKVSTSNILDYNVKKEETRPLLNLRKKLYQFLKQNKLSKRDVLLYIPKEIFEKEMFVSVKKKWAKGMLFYAVTGIPLVNGVQKIDSIYGYLEYGEETLWTQLNKFDKEKVCKMIDRRYVITINDLDKPIFELYMCEKLEKGED